MITEVQETILQKIAHLAPREGHPDQIKAYHLCREGFGIGRNEAAHAIGPVFAHRLETICDCKACENYRKLNSVEG